MCLQTLLTCDMIYHYWFSCSCFFIVGPGTCCWHEQRNLWNGAVIRIITSATSESVFLDIMYCSMWSVDCWLTVANWVSLILVDHLQLFGDTFFYSSSYYTIDTVVGLCIAIITIGTIWPIATCSGKVLLNSTPPYLLSQLDKILSEAQTLGKLT